MDLILFRRCKVTIKKTNIQKIQPFSVIFSRHNTLQLIIRAFRNTISVSKTKKSRTKPALYVYCILTKFEYHLLHRDMV